MMDPLRSETCWSTFKYFIILIVSTCYILCIGWVIKCLSSFLCDKSILYLIVNSSIHFLGGFVLTYLWIYAPPSKIIFGAKTIGQNSASGYPSLQYFQGDNDYFIVHSRNTAVFHS